MARQPHAAETGLALIAEAERIVAEGGPGALSVRSVADAAGTTSRAVYSLFGSKDGLVDALARRAFELLAESLDTIPETDDPAADLVEVGAVALRGLVREHPSLHRIAFHRIVPPPPEGAEYTAARAAVYARLRERIVRLEEAGGLNGITVEDAFFNFAAVCDGVATLELRHGFGVDDEREYERRWRSALAAMLRGFRLPPE